MNRRLASFPVVRSSQYVWETYTPPRSPMRVRALATSAVWLGPLGAVRLLLRPSWLTTVLCTNARAVAWSSAGCIMATAQPSPRPYPSPVTSNVLQRPTGDNACTVGIVISVAPVPLCPMEFVLHAACTCSKR